MGYLFSFVAGYVVCYIGVEKILEKSKTAAVSVISLINNKIKKVPSEVVVENKNNSGE